MKKIFYKNNNTFVKNHSELSHHKQDKILVRNDENEFETRLKENMINQIKQIVTREDPHGILFIPKGLQKRYPDKETFEDEFLRKMFNKVSKMTGIDIEIIISIMQNRIIYGRD